MAIQLKTKPGINGANVLAIPKDWDPVWFRHFVNNQLKGADVRNAVGTGGITISGNISSPYATIGFTGGAGTIATITSIDGTVAVTNPTGPSTDLSVIAARSFNVTPDTHSTVPTGVGLGPNDEFEVGASIDTTGTRYPSATPWTAFNLSTASSSVASGVLQFLPALSAAVSINGYTQPVSGTWTYVAKISQYNPNPSGGIGLILAASSGAAGNIISYNISQAILEIQRFTNATTFSSSVVSRSGAIPIVPGADALAYTWIYLKITYDGTNITFSYSYSGLPNTFVLLRSETSVSFLGTPTLIGLGGFLQSNSVQGVLFLDWFRRTA